MQYLPGPLSDGLVSTTDPHQFRASWDWVATPHVILHSYWSASFDNQQWNNPLQNGYGCKLGFTELACGTNQDATPQVTFAGGPTTYTGWGMNQGKVNNGGQRNHILMEGQNLTWTRNKHEFKMGWEIRRSATLNNDWSTTNGIYNFSNTQTAAVARKHHDGRFLCQLPAGNAQLRQSRQSADFSSEHPVCLHGGVFPGLLESISQPDVQFGSPLRGSHRLALCEWYVL